MPHMLRNHTPAVNRGSDEIYGPWGAAKQQEGKKEKMPFQITALKRLARLGCLGSHNQASPSTSGASAVTIRAWSLVHCRRLRGLSRGRGLAKGLAAGHAASTNHPLRPRAAAAAKALCLSRHVTTTLALGLAASCVCGGGRRRSGVGEGVVLERGGGVGEGGVLERGVVLEREWEKGVGHAHAHNHTQACR